MHQTIENLMRDRLEFGLFQGTLLRIPRTVFSTYLGAEDRAGTGPTLLCQAMPCSCEWSLVDLMYDVGEVKAAQLQVSFSPFGALLETDNAFIITTPGPVWKLPAERMQYRNSTSSRTWIMGIDHGKVGIYLSTMVGALCHERMEVSVPQAYSMRSPPNEGGEVVCTRGGQRTQAGENLAQVGRYGTHHYSSGGKEIGRGMGMGMGKGMGVGAG
ncbi:hypothetical protein LZ30DRAFT_689390 [Colletotrichum cereale]|nr:hypothetical protein LZ30DRAFT_689390 [Colletotrichum cereale]